MRSLYLKIFLWFWAAMILLVVTVFWVTYQVADPGAASRPRAARMAFRAVRDMQGLADVISARGIDAARPFLSNNQRGWHPRVFVLDARGRDVLGRRLPPWVGDMEGGPAGHDKRVAVVTESVTAPSGERYRMMALVPTGAPAAAPDGAFMRQQEPKSSGARALKSAGRIFRGPAEIQWLRLGVAVLVSGLVCFLLARYLTGPLAQLRGATRSLAEGDLAARVGASVTARRDEIGALGRDFDAMAERVEGLVTSQQRLLRDVSHELRSPLSRLQVALGLARKRAGAEVTADLDRIELETERVNELIGQILTLTRLERDLAAEQLVPVELVNIVREVVEDANYEAGASQRKVALGETESGKVQGRPRLLHSAIENVVRNAVRYTAEQTTVEVSMASSEKTITVRVRDHGPGVADAALGQLFEPFYRVDEAREREGGGYGIGLAITERTIRRHGGRVRAHNHPGGGLTVELELPRCEPVR
ncbi:MAG TPA: ATP-binding protein [Gammaproteobacteria bacterium]|nr:ATP-binding protein [Gammaproteobacteria bacterium]